MNFSDIENQTDDLLLLNPVTAEIPKLTLHCHNKYLEFKNALSEYNTEELRKLVKYNLDIKDYKVLNTLDSQDLKNALSAKQGNELLKRIQGISEYSNAVSDPFKSLGNFKPNETTLMDTLNAMHGNSSTLGIEGIYRAYNGNDYIEIMVKPMSYAQDIWLQTISGILQPMPDGTFTLAQKYMVYERTHKNGAWDEWQTALDLNDETEQIKNDLTDEIARAKDAEAELLARLQGESESSDPMADPFVKLFAGNSAALAEVLDSTIESGRYRIVYGGFTHVDLNVWARSNGTIIQTIEGFIKNYEGGIDVSEKRNCYTRERVNNVWSKWHPEKSLAGKSIAFFGGSMCHLAVGKGSISQYSDTTKSNTITENIGYIREQLEYYGANIVNYAVSGSGFLRPINSKTIFSQASNAGVHDIYVIWASTNDWTMGTYLLGEFDDFQKDGKVETVCGALNATISALIDKNKNAKIYVLLPMKGVDTRGFDFTNGKYGNAMFDAVSPYWKNPMGYTFGEYINAVIKVCTYRGVAVVDTFSAPNLMYQTIINSAITGLYWNEGLLVGGSDVYVGYYIHPRRAGYKAVWEVIKRTLIDGYGEHIVQQAAIYSEQERAKAAEQANVAAINAETARAQTAESAAIEKGRQLALRDLFVDAGALYNDTTATIMRTAPWGESVQHLAGHYYLNGLGDVTEKQMMKIYTRKEALRNMNGRSCQLLANIRTYIPIAYNSNAIQFVYDATSPLYIFGGNTALEILLWSAVKPFSLNPTYEHAVPVVGDCKAMFSGCTALKIIGALTLSGATSVANMFQGCSALEYVFLRGIKVSISLSDSPNVAKESVLYSIVNATPTTAITITLHADAYARLAEDADIVTALEAQPLVTIVSA